MGSVIRRPRPNLARLPEESSWKAPTSDIGRALEPEPKSHGVPASAGRRARSATRVRFPAPDRLKAELQTGSWKDLRTLNARWGYEPARADRNVGAPVKCAGPEKRLRHLPLALATRTCHSHLPLAPQLQHFALSPSLVSQRVDRIELRGFSRGIKPKENPHRRAKNKRYNDRVHRGQRRPVHL
jgi:hypothetical protein